MRFIKLSGTFLAGALFLTSCNVAQPDKAAQLNSYPEETVQTEAVNEADIEFARANLDLQAIGALLERADNAQELEYLLNSDNRVNNLDLNRDGYADYISVAEFEDRNDGERGLALFSRFGPDLIQEIATIIFDRNGLDSRGARVLLAGNEQLFGENQYYEANWLDRALPVVTWLFSDRDSAYNSPYYYNNYPDYYEPYEVVETPVYRTRIREIYTEPVFVYTTSPTINQIQISSPYRGRTVTEVFPISAGREEDRAEGRNNRQGPPEFVPVRKGWTKNDAPKSDKQPKGNPDDSEKPRKNDAEKSEKRENRKNARGDAPKPQKADKPEFNPNKPDKVDKSEVKSQKPDKPGRGKGAGNNPGKGNGGGKDKDKGGGKKN